MAYRYVSFGESQGANRVANDRGLSQALSSLRRDQGGWIVRSGSHRRLLCLG